MTNIVRLKGFELLQKRLRKTSNFNKARVTTHQALEVIWRDAAEAFVKAAVVRVLVDSGMSVATFFPLARQIRRQGAEAIIRQALTNVKSYQTRYKGIPQFPDGHRSIGGYQNIAAGESRGKDAFTFTTGTPQNYRFRFRFQTVAWQHSLYEPQQQSLEAGFAAFASTVQSRLRGELVGALEEWLTDRRRIRINSSRNNIPIDQLRLLIETLRVQ